MVFYHLTIQIFDWIKELLGKAQQERVLLRVQVVSHDIGRILRPSSNQIHSRYLIKNIELVVPTDYQLKSIIFLAGYCSSETPSKKHAVFQNLAF
jgi:exopolyphosphatase/pppGpp-phosphohydrolase